MGKGGGDRNRWGERKLKGGEDPSMHPYTINPEALLG